ncbi:Phosphocarrier protein HPr [Candidatus Izimaplasma bacterium HR1]|uniref:HPr family phosphocarrier protein n=1 Tax=Candidatus Izimoplasma sp. HR1 TaxID=1541959 RepID=UPI0004F5C7F4|nr:Phosphocarrier protein HPr [Candidatus Izimaplasma bacterium HR1]
MKKSFLIINQTGLHARPAANFVRCTSSIPAHILLECDGHETDAKSIMGVIGMQIVKGQIITLTMDNDEERLMKIIENHLVENQIAKEVK